MTTRLGRIALLLVLLCTGYAPRTSHLEPARAADCLADQEPNDAPETATALAGAFCVDGTLGNGDQDVLLWTVAGSGETTRWSITVKGIPGTQTDLKILRVTSPPGTTPLRFSNQLLEIGSPPDASGPITKEKLLFSAGVYLLGISRSGTADGTKPITDKYAISIAQGDALPPPGDPEPNDSAESATSLESAFAISGDVQGSEDWYTWTLSGEDAAKGWELHAQGGVGETFSLEFLDPNGASMLTAPASPAGKIDLYDLGLAAGSYRIRLFPPADHTVRYALQTVPVGNRPTEDVEPNDDVAHASPLDPANPVVRGRLGRDGDLDVYRLTVDADLGATQFDLKLIWRSNRTRQLCVLDNQGQQLQCRSGTGGVALPNVLLPAGDYGLAVSGDPAPDDPYVLRLDKTSAPATDFESEPNDNVKQATALAPNLLMRGRTSGADLDYYRLTVDGEPQLWRVDVEGTGIGRVSLVGASGSPLTSGETSLDATHAQLSDLFLTPGDHWLAVEGAGSDYTIRAVPIGPPDPDGEREPNNSVTDAMPLPIGPAKTGRLVEVTDVDEYRFSLQATEHVAIALTPPTDGAVSIRLEWGNTVVAKIDSPQPGEPSTYDALLLPGDYQIVLSPIQTSEGTYQLAVNRLDPFALSVDQEPNDDLARAWPLPGTLTASGSVGITGDIDWYTLPVLDTASGITLSVEGTVTVTLTDGVADLPLTPGADGTSFQGQVPAGGSFALRVSGSGDYRVSVAFNTGPQPLPDPTAPSVELALTVPVTEVQAYSTAGQRIDGQLTLTAGGILNQTLTLDAVTSHYGWTATLGETEVRVPAGGSAIVLVTVDVGPDAWSDVPVRISVRARNATGGQQTTSVEINPRQDAAPVAPEQTWTLQGALLGGLDVASLALGAQPITSVDPDGEARLHDGMSPAGGGLSTIPPAFPLTLTVDLAGDDPVPVSGVTLNPNGGIGWPEERVRRFALLLSEDGQAYTEVLTGELSQLAIDQAFALASPVSARFAQLRIDSNFGTAGSKVTLGEWKVIAQPGFVPASATTLNLADPARGGHVVWLDPQGPTPDLAKSLVSDDRARQTLDLKEGMTPQWVIGFQDDRVAQITSLEWVDPDGTTPETRFSTVEVAVSTVSPVGPWEPLGTWDLTRAGDGSVEPLDLDQPVWARFVRFTGNGPDQQTTWEYPAAIRIVERATDGEYRSVLGQWGDGNRAGIYEALNPPDFTTNAEADHNDTPAAAQPLALEEAAPGRVQIDKDVDWYRVTVPDGQKSLEFAVTGDPTVGVTVSLQDAAGNEIPVQEQESEDPGQTTFVAAVSGGADYFVKVEQPAHSVVFAFDTSTSLANYQPFVFGALTSFAGGVQPGQEAVNLLPFDEQFLLEDWADQPYLIQSAVNGYTDELLSSSAESGLIEATKALASRPGTKAILLLTDAETSSYPRNAEAWQTLASVQPRLFTVQIGEGADPAMQRDMMQDWATVGAGYYQYASTHGEVDRAFDRATAWLRRPVDYTLTVKASAAAIATATPEPAATAEPAQTPEPTAAPTEEAQPGSIRVVAAKAEEGETSQPAVAAGVAVEIILDTSGSMLEEIEPGRTRIDVAKEVLADLVTNTLPPGAPVALRIFGSEPDSCDTQLAVPLQPLDGEAMAATIEGIDLVNLVNTPLGASLEQVANDLKDVSGPKIVVLVTDGEETCDGDPRQAIADLAAQGIDVHVNIVGFALDDDTLKKQFQQWAKLGNGLYVDAGNAGELGTAVGQAVAPPFRVLDDTGSVVATGVVGGSSVSVPPGVYTIEVLSDPVQRFDNVEVGPGKKVTLRLQRE